MNFTKKLQERKLRRKIFEAENLGYLVGKEVGYTLRSYLPISIHLKDPPERMSHPINGLHLPELDAAYSRGYQEGFHRGKLLAMGDLLNKELMKEYQ